MLGHHLSNTFISVVFDDLMKLQRNARKVTDNIQFNLFNISAHEISSKYLHDERKNCRQRSAQDKRKGIPPMEQLLSASRRCSPMYNAKSTSKAGKDFVRVPNVLHRFVFFSFPDSEHPVHTGSFNDSVLLRA